VDAVGLEQGFRIRRVGHALQQKGHERCALVLGHSGEQRRKITAVLAAVVRWDLHPHNDDLRADVGRCLDHRGQVLAGHLERQATQGVVAAQFDDHVRRPVQLQQGRQARTPARGGVAADAGVDDRRVDTLLREAFFEQRDPAFAAPQPVLGRQAVAYDQNHRFRRARLAGLGRSRPHEPGGHTKRGTLNQPGPARDLLHCCPFLCIANFMSESIIAVDRVTKQVHDSTGTLTILHEISFSLAVRQSAAIVGASGSGKSTLLSIIAGLDTPTTGTVRLAGTDLFALNEDARAAVRAAKLGFVFQSFQLLGNLTALENVMLPLELQGRDDARARAAEMLRHVGLGERLSHYPKVLSGGEQQRVALARAFVVKPAVLLADEPTGSLDFANGGTVMALMFELNREAGTTLVLVTHDRAIAERCDRQLRIEAGRLSVD
jgi:putative ABC transport system ATP-binding protein